MGSDSSALASTEKGGGGGKGGRALETSNLARGQVKS